eukprot:6401255-Alexandrium_andersonii.AAC.1
MSLPLPRRWTLPEQGVGVLVAGGGARREEARLPFRPVPGEQPHEGVAFPSVADLPGPGEA